MLVLAFLFALGLSSVAASGPPSSSENLLAKGVRELPILGGNSGALVQERHIAADFHGSGRMVWAKRERLLHSFLAAIVSLGTVLVAVFLVLQCFRALASDHQALYKYRRLSEDRGPDPPDCTVRAWKSGSERRIASSPLLQLPQAESLRATADGPSIVKAKMQMRLFSP
ncbi:hypothetical protein Efla_007430 [Eimeria flavescens]